VVARNIAGIIQAIHDEGYVLGDIKLQNILVNNRALPTIIDTDSFQVVDPIQNKVYRCLVASEGFTPSELIGKNIDSITQSAVHDRFRLGVVIYYLLFGGPPFRGSWQGSGDPPEQVELIRRGFWPYAPNSLIQPNHNTIPLDVIHPELQRCFLLCFNDGHFNPSKRPSARVWLGALEVAFNELQSCGKVDSHFYGLSYGHCYWCDRAQNLGIDIFLGNPVTKAIQTSSFQNTNQQKIVVKFANSKNISQTTQGKSQHKQVLIKKGNLKSKWLWGSFTSFLIICSGILVWFFYFKQSDDRNRSGGQNLII
jgi:DNA-binding helix-hairpin-helix protein with protein kinase domain